MIAEGGRRASQRRPEFDLVGVWVHSEAKVGKDAGELANGAPFGLAATNDADALIGLKPDCVIYAASRAMGQHSRRDRRRRTRLAHRHRRSVLPRHDHG